jgi:chemotaxis receptor (MCP) glutamine deamidase CheD
VNELLIMAVWAANVIGAHIAFHARRVKLMPAMYKLRKGLAPVALMVFGLASQASANCLPAPVFGGAGIEHEEPTAVRRDGISLDEAVRRAEAQYRARVVRTDVQDEDGRKVYVLKLLSEDGRVITVRIDAATGRMR